MTYFDSMLDKADDSVEQLFQGFSLLMAQLRRKIPSANRATVGASAADC
ncbi:hypothetical protein [Yersinia wautersii]|nr:hypothetical protein [Yersinia wautersii]